MGDKTLSTTNDTIRSLLDALDLEGPVSQLPDVLPTPDHDERLQYVTLLRFAIGVPVNGALTVDQGQAVLDEAERRAGDHHITAKVQFSIIVDGRIATQNFDVRFPDSNPALEDTESMAPVDAPRFADPPSADAAEWDVPKPTDDSPMTMVDPTDGQDRDLPGPLESGAHTRAYLRSQGHGVGSSDEKRWWWFTILAMIGSVVLMGISHTVRTGDHADLGLLGLMLVMVCMIVPLTPIWALRKYGVLTHLPHALIGLSGALLLVSCVIGLVRIGLLAAWLAWLLGGLVLLTLAVIALAVWAYKRGMLPAGLIGR